MGAHPPPADVGHNISGSFSSFLCARESPSISNTKKKEIPCQGKGMSAKKRKVRQSFLGCLWRLRPMLTKAEWLWARRVVARERVGRGKRKKKSKGKEGMGLFAHTPAHNKITQKKGEGQGMAGMAWLLLLRACSPALSFSFLSLSISACWFVSLLFLSMPARISEIRRKSMWSFSVQACLHVQRETK